MGLLVVQDISYTSYCQGDKICNIIFKFSKFFIVAHTILSFASMGNLSFRDTIEILRVYVFLRSGQNKGKGYQYQGAFKGWQMGCTSTFLYDEGRFL